MMGFAGPVKKKENDFLMSSADNPPRSRHMQLTIAVLLIYFFSRLVYFAGTISSYVPPDEVTHLGLAKVFSGAFLLPENSPETYQYGLVTNVPWLYCWLMGKLLWLNVFGLPDLLFLRLVNIPFAFGTLYFSWRLLRLLTDNRLSQILLVVVMTNTLMFSFLSASVSYDNLTNLLAIMATYYLFAYFKGRSFESLLRAVLCLLAGCLTKVSFLPLALFLSLLWAFYEFGKWKLLPASARAYWQESGWRCLWLFPILVGLILNLQLHGGNYFRYGKLVPDMHVVLSPEIALKNRIAARDMIVDFFKERQIDYRQAMRMASLIDHPGDREDTYYLIRSLIENRNSGYRPMGPVEYIIPWAERVAATTFGIMGHVSIYNEGVTIVPIAVLLGLAVVGFIVRWRPADLARLPAALAVLCGSYALFLMYFHNYRVYLYYENFTMGLQGRYIFPVMGSLCVLFSYYLVHLFRRESLQLGVVIAATIVFVASDFPFFLYYSIRYGFGS